MEQSINQIGTIIVDPAIEMEWVLVEDVDATASTAVSDRYKVIAHDDDFTSMEFVVRIMMQVFKKPIIFAEMIMWQVHNEGMSVVDVLPKAEAEHRVNKATAAARLEGFPFRFTIELEE